MSFNYHNSKGGAEGTFGGCNVFAAGKHAQEVIDGVFFRGVCIGHRVDSHGDAWITPEIVRGGFSTGRHLAGGPPKPHEAALASSNNISHGFFHPRTLRGAINMWCVTHPEGREWLLGLGSSGLYRTPTAEEGCLLAIVLIEQAGVSADDILKEVAPYFDHLRFFPEPANVPAPRNGASSVRSVGNLLTVLTRKLLSFEGKYKVNQRRVMELNSTYFPTYRAVVEEARRFCSRWRTADGAAAGTSDLNVNLLPLKVLQNTLNVLGFEKKMRRSSLHKLFDALEVAAKHGRKTTKTFIEHMERMISDASAKLASRPPIVGNILVQQRLLLSSQKQAFFVQLKRLVKELELHESPAFGLPKGVVEGMSSQFPLFKAKIESLTLGTLQEVAAARLLASPEQLAHQAEAAIVRHNADALSTEATRTLARHILTAFLARRSRLLLDLSSQVKVSELPWYRVLTETFVRQPRKEAQDGRDVGATSTVSATAGKTLAQEVFRIYLTSFAGVQLPNRLVMLLGDHLGCRGLVKEIAADIFMGSFHSDFVVQAQLRKEILGPSSPYDIYYANELVEFPPCDDDQGRIIDGFRSAVAEDYRGFVYVGRGRSVVENGILIERAAVTTTHNLLHLLVAMGMDEEEELLEVAAGVALARLIQALRSGRSHYKFLRDESRRAANACRAFMVLVSLLKKRLGGQVPPKLIARLKEPSGTVATTTEGTASAGISEERALVLQGILSVLEGQERKTPPLMGWSPSRARHPVFFAPPAKKQRVKA